MQRLRRGWRWAGAALVVGLLARSAQAGAGAGGQGRSDAARAGGGSAAVGAVGYEQEAGEARRGSGRRRFLGRLPALALATLAALPGCAQAALAPALGTSATGADGARSRSALKALERFGALEAFTARQLLPISLWLPRAEAEDASADVVASRRKAALNAGLWLFALRSGAAGSHFFDPPTAQPQLSGEVRLVLTETGDPWVRETFTGGALDARIDAATVATLSPPRAGASGREPPRLEATVALFFDRLMGDAVGAPALRTAVALARQLDGVILGAARAALEVGPAREAMLARRSVEARAQVAALRFAEQKLAVAAQTGNVPAIATWKAELAQARAVAAAGTGAFAFVSVAP
ncbi:MAG: hypothetical protein IPL40_03640 [Proteobacteria bacterium]|nr:hypothetical protein [Pseudomonadota bacterium]